VNVKISFRISESAQRAAIAVINQPVPREQSLVADLPVADLDVCYIHQDGTALLDCELKENREALFAAAPTGGPTYGTYWFPAIPDPLAIPDLIRRGRAMLAESKRLEGAKEAAAKEAKDAAHLQAEIDAVRAFLSDPAARGQRTSSSVLLAATGAVADTYGSVPGGRAIYLRLHPDLSRIQAEVDARNANDAAAKESAEEAKEAAKSDTINA
jgi:hypothetical protein